MSHGLNVINHKNINGIPRPRRSGSHVSPGSCRAGPRPPRIPDSWRIHTFVSRAASAHWPARPAPSTHTRQPPRRRPAHPPRVLRIQQIRRRSQAGESGKCCKLELAKGTPQETNLGNDAKKKVAFRSVKVRPFAERKATICRVRSGSDGNRHPEIPLQASRGSVTAQHPLPRRSSQAKTCLKDRPAKVHNGTSCSCERTRIPTGGPSS